MKLLVFLMLGLVASALASSTGSSTCDPSYSSNMGGMDKIVQTTADPSPYSLDLSATSVATGATVTISVTGATYKGVLAFVNVDGGLSDGTETVGVFTADTANKFQNKDCGSATGAITHASADDKTTESFTWTAPSTAGTYKLYSMVASGGNTVSDTRTVGYWSLDAVTITVTAAATCSNADCSACSTDTTCTDASCTWDSTSTCVDTPVCSNADCSACASEATCGAGTATSCTWSATTASCSGSCSATSLIPCLGCIENDCDSTSGCEWYSEDGVGLCLTEGSGASGLQASVFVLVAAFFVGMFNM